MEMQVQFSPGLYKDATLGVANRETWCGYCGRNIHRGDPVAVTEGGHEFCLGCVVKKEASDE